MFLVNRGLHVTTYTLFEMPFNKFESDEDIISSFFYLGVTSSTKMHYKLAKGEESKLSKYRRQLPSSNIPDFHPPVLPLIAGLPCRSSDPSFV